MSWRNQRAFNIIIILLSWLTLAFLGRRNTKRFLPATLLVLLVEVWNTQIGKKKKWWVYYNKPKSYFSGEFPINIGPFFVGSMWILKQTFGEFKKFILLNATTNAFFAFFISKLTAKLKVVRLVRINEFQFFFYMFYKAFLLYGFQYLFESLNKRK